MKLTLDIRPAVVVPSGRPDWGTDIPVNTWFDLPNSQMLSPEVGKGLDPSYLDRVYAGTSQGPVRKGSSASLTIVQPANKYGMVNTIGYRTWVYTQEHATYSSRAYSRRTKRLYALDSDTHFPSNCVAYWDAATATWGIAINGAVAKDFKCGDYRVAPAWKRDAKPAYGFGGRVWYVCADSKVRIYVVRVPGASLGAAVPVPPGAINEVIQDGDYTLQEEAFPMERNMVYLFGERASVTCTDGKTHSYIMIEQGGPLPLPEFVGRTAAVAPVFTGNKQENVIDGTCMWQEGEYFGIPDAPPQGNDSPDPFKHYDGTDMGGHTYSQLSVHDQNPAWRPIFIRSGPLTNRYPLDTGGKQNGYSVGWLDTREWAKDYKMNGWRGTVLGKRIGVGEPTELRKCQHPATGDLFEIFDKWIVRTRRVSDTESVQEPIIELQQGTLYNSVIAVDPDRNLLVGCSINANKREWWTLPCDAPAITAVGQFGTQRTMVTLTGPDAGALTNNAMYYPRTAEGMEYADVMLWYAVYHNPALHDDNGLFKLEVVSPTEMKVTKLATTGTIAPAGLNPDLWWGGTAGPTNKLKYDPDYSLLMLFTTDRLQGRGIFLK